MCRLLAQKSTKTTSELSSCGPSLHQKDTAIPYTNYKRRSMSFTLMPQRSEKLVAAGHLSEALVAATEELNLDVRSIAAHLNKGSIHNKLKQYREAQTEISTAFALARESEQQKDSTVIGDCLFKLFTVFYNMEKFMDCVKLLNMAKEYGCTNPELPIREFNFKKKVNKFGFPVDFAAKYGSLDDVPVDKVDLDQLAEIKIEPKETATKKKIATPHTVTTELPKETPEEIELQKRQLEQKMLNKDNLYPNPKNIKLDWFQSADLVTASMFVKNLPKDDKLKIKYNKDSISIQFPTSATSEFQYEIGPLFAYIDPTECSEKVFSTKVEFYLKKADRTIKWKKLERSENENAVGTLPAYPTSSLKKTNWNNLKIDDADIDEPPEDGMKSLYKQANEDSQRAMMKSFVESNGTVLSMDWNDVGSRKVEMAPPDGVEARDYPR